ncbi:MAG: leucine-rich repeat protein [Clostridiales bacterium]|nr:leucine-rich repeat protein [Clostridiales bacterium]
MADEASKSTNNVKFKIEGAILYECLGDGDIVIPDGVEVINEKAFYFCSNITSVTIPPSVTRIGKDAFEYCGHLQAVYIRDITAWCNIFFENHRANPLNLAHNLYLNGELVTDWVVPATVRKIGNNAFQGCYSLTSVNMYATSMDSIGKFAFDECRNIKSVTIGKCVKSIGSYAFHMCYALTSVAIPESVTEIGSNVFSWCPNLAEVTLSGSPKKIGDDVFAECQALTSITIPNTYQYFGTGMFKNCKNLKNITMPKRLKEMAKTYSIFIGTPIFKKVKYY